MEAFFVCSLSTRLFYEEGSLRSISLLLGTIFAWAVLESDASAAREQYCALANVPLAVQHSITRRISQWLDSFKTVYPSNMPYPTFHLRLFSHVRRSIMLDPLVWFILFMRMVLAIYCNRLSGTDSLAILLLFWAFPQT